MHRNEVVALRRGRYEVVLERDESGRWLAHVPSVAGCHTHGRTLAQTRERIREALSLWVEDADTASLVEELRLPQGALADIRRSRLARSRAERERVRATESTSEAARVLVGDLGLSVRDAAALLGLSHQRVQQLGGR